MAVHLPLSMEAQAEARLLMFSHMNLLSPTIGDPISIPTQDMLIGLYLLTSGNPRGIGANRYNPWNRKNLKNERILANNNKYTKEPLFCNSYQGFDRFRNREISTGAGGIREELADLDLRIIIDYSLVEWKELGEVIPDYFNTCSN